MARDSSSSFFGGICGEEFIGTECGNLVNTLSMNREIYLSFSRVVDGTVKFNNLPNNLITVNWCLTV